MKALILYLLCNLLFFTCTAQNENILYVKNTTAENRVKQYRNLVNNSINKNLSLPLTDSTEEYWQDAFAAMELINYKQPWANEKINLAMNGIEKRSTGFQRAALELIYALQNKEYTAQVYKLLIQTGNSKVFAMCAEYLMLYNNPSPDNEIMTIVRNKLNAVKEKNDYAIMISLLNRLANKTREQSHESINFAPLFGKDYLYGNVILYSIQRKNRNYPGIAIVRDKNGNFIVDELGNIFSVPQLARSISNLPGYLTNGNTPQGIFRMDGFAVSKSSFIGPTENIQLTMPNETTAPHFIRDSTVTDTIFSYQVYADLLPADLKNYQPLSESFQAGMAGRTEIIAHGTTVNPDYYTNQPYYPLTPTQGCLCTKEIWSKIDGKRTESDQQKLVNALKVAGGANGYCIVIEIDDLQKPVSIDDILPYLKPESK